MRAAVLILCVLPACTQADGTTAIGMVGSPAWMATASTETKLAIYRANCAGYGYVAGTPAMASCMQQESRDFRDNASTTMAAGALAAAEVSRPDPVSVRSPTTTNCTGYGNTVHCTSY